MAYSASTHTRTEQGAEPMPRHDVEIVIPPKVVLNSDVRFVIRSDGQKLGELLVSKGTIAWVPGHSPQAIHIPWERFDEWMREERAQRRRR